MLVSPRPGVRWLPLRVADCEDWQSELLADAAQRLGAELASEGRVFRWSAVGSPATFKGARVWLRVSAFLENTMDAEAWRGTFEAGAITGVCKPTLLDRVLWETDAPVAVPVSGEMLTFIPDPVASTRRFLMEPPVSAPGWFRDLRSSLDALAEVPTDRRFRVHNAEQYGYLLAATYGRPLPSGIVPEFGTEHIDLTWGNISAPGFTIIDWEHWGVAVKGYGIAYLYLTSLAVPEVAGRIRETCADLLDSPTGRYAQLVAAAFIRRNLTHLPDEAGLAPMLHRHTTALLDEAL
ncbi:hypothetical protein ACU686_12895 [Yinghuangia aomiensis]